MKEVAKERYRELINELWNCDERVIGIIIKKWQMYNPLLYVNVRLTVLHILELEDKNDYNKFEKGLLELWGVE